MKVLSLGIGIGVVVTTAVLTLGGAAIQQDPSEKTQQNMDQMQKMMEMGQKMATPGKEQKWYEQFVGEWNTSTVTMGMAPEKGTASMKMILGGRFLESHHQGKFMGMPMKGLGFAGYDNYKKKYTQMWVSSMSTAMSHSEGLMDQSGKRLTYWGTMDEWMTGEMDKPVKYVYQYVNKDKFVFEIHDLGIVPGETKVTEITYTRKEG